jgi:hypothetical protein
MAGHPVGEAGLRGSVACLEATRAEARDVVPRNHDHQGKQDPGEFKLRQVLHDAHGPKVADRGDDTTHPRALACAARLRSTPDAEAIHIVLTSDRSREPGEETEAGHSATPRPCGLTNGSM